MENPSPTRTTNLQRIRSLYRLQEDKNNLNIPEPINGKVQEIDTKESLENVDRYGNYRSDFNVNNLGFYKVSKDPTLDKPNPAKRLGNKLIGHDDMLKYVDESIFMVVPGESHDRNEISAKELSRIQKWKSMCSIHLVSGNQLHSFRKTRKLILRTFKGIPDCWRSIAWWSFLVDSLPDKKLIDKYYQLNEQICDYDVQIDLDVPRTAATHFLFRKRYIGGQRLLFRVLHAVALYIPRVGYVQGMASIAATLLIYYPEEQAFIMMVNLLENRGMGDLFSSGFDTLLKAFDMLKHELSFTQSGRHLAEIGAEPSAFATRWYLTVFHQCVPFHTQLRIWDLLFLLGGSKGQTVRLLQATSLAVIQGMWDTLIDADFEVVMQALSGVIPIQNDNALLARIQLFWEKMPSENSSKSKRN
ncbi:RabGAP [Schizosaccharomyces pombe]|uniref:TBC domain-containing protein C1778.09 n=1 Tax=Schizosaccharomyces pombe (strain 972 / ATCC 24843) TaxID=284812 RepID=YOI9_SCHPO|nr:putative GTPase-activating protein [Schizosaccharomyces pombe]Q9Y7J5.1 RecName: Full=TBC domain-containing protein C1778.09 [Schizosaccharomyces pombe 972h-]CAB39804.1 GTPase activating protein (predicted) [Schizosaccharomyces pombe]|eukprot:NP_596292.1 putative GTPase-activating protein [Schizosaccharomyces pombe]